MSLYPELRMRRIRKSDWVRRLVRESILSVNDLIWPLIVTDNPHDSHIDAMPGVNRLGIEGIVNAAKEARDLGIPAIALFPHISARYKNEQGSEALNAEGLIPETLRAIKAEITDIGVIVDVALDPYTSHGHDGILQDGQIINDASVDILTQSALILAQAGADIVAPSDMMDGRVGSIRTALEAQGHTQTLILSYAAKYASSFYGPFREAVGSAQNLQGDKKTYQMDIGNRLEALREVALDIEEGADLVMVKPGIAFLDVIREVKLNYQIPVFAFQVSGEYAMIKAAGKENWLNEKAVMMESLTCFKRAGADGILTYFARNIAEELAR